MFVPSYGIVERLCRDVGLLQRPVERLHLEVEGVGEAGVDGRAVEQVVRDAEVRGGAQVAVAGVSPVSLRRGGVALGDQSLGEGDERVVERAVVAGGHLRDERVWTSPTSPPP